ncbi:hypothetical protein [Granulicella tundricola]|uniref:hypothetical protein n=1 Tax=Granulicella tundricola TaxID=940615 RepID=UPI0001DB74D3|nr:hypothetical protein [Granulicella tundricola]
MNVKTLALAALVSLPLAASAQQTIATLDLPEAPGTGAAAHFQAEPTVLRNTRPFSSLAVAVKIGVAGIGFDVATPLSTRFNLRAGASFFGYQTNFTTDGIPIDGNLKLRNAAASVDWYPFHGSFRISSGITLYNDNNIAATILVPAARPSPSTTPTTPQTPPTPSTETPPSNSATRSPPASRSASAT